MSKAAQSKKQLHDAFFKEIFGDKKYCLDIFRLVLTPEQFAMFDWSTIQSELTTLIDEELNEKRIDLIFSVERKRTRKQTRILFLLEHKSGQYAELLQQLLGYQAQIYKKSTHAVIPILVYHGKDREWKRPLNFQDSLALGPAIRREFGENIVNFTCKLLNLQDLGTEDIRELTSGPAIYIMQKIWDVKKSTLKELFDLGPKLKGVSNKEERQGIIERAVDYVCQYNPKLWKVVKEIEAQGLPEEERVMPPLKYSLDLAKEEGLEQGRTEGEKKKAVEIALKLLEAGTEPRFISKTTGLSLKEIRELAKQA